jgi:predicted negative regulator of RcsB-dependent stress response
MRAFVFTDPALTSRAGQFVWLELNLDDERNAAPRERLGLDALPTFYVLDSSDGSVAARQVGALTVAEMGVFLDDALRALGSGTPSSPAEAALRRADRLNGRGKKDEAAAAYREALDAAPPAWPPYARAVAALVFIHQSTGRPEECVGLAREALPRLARAPISVSVATGGLDCALSLPADSAGREAAIAASEAALRRLLADPPAGAAADELSSGRAALTRARKASGDEAGARNDAEAWAAFLEGQAAAAKTAEERAVFDSHRLSAYLELGQPERAVAMLQESERELPWDYNPPARLAVAYLAMKKLDEALAASSRALPKVTGPRRVRVLQNRADVLAAKGDPAAAREALSQALAHAESLPVGQRSEAAIQALRKRLGAPRSRPARRRSRLIRR